MLTGIKDGGIRLRVLLIIDVWGWAFDFVGRGIRKYSKHDITIKRWNELNLEDKDNTDCLFCMNDSVWFVMRDNRQKYFRDISNKCLGIRGEEMPSNRIISGWKIGCVNQKIYDDLKSKPNLPVNGIYLTRNGVDMEIFKPIDRPKNRFVVGWAGNPHQPLKRYHLLQHVNYPLLVQTKHGAKYFRKERTRDEMISFYSKIDTFISVSIHEGMPQSIMEAAATKLPIVVTNAGGMAEFVDSEWVIPVKPEKLTMKELNNKCEILKDDYKLRLKIGEDNYKKIVDEWNWKNRVKEYDKMFEGE